MPSKPASLTDLRIGEEAGVSGWIEITQEMIDRFAAITGDNQWIHVDRQRAASESPFKGTVAHGFLTLSLLSAMTRQAVELQTGFALSVNYGVNRVRFVSPVPAGSLVRGHFTPQKVGDNEVIWQVMVEREGAEKPVLVAEWIVRFY